jgi:integrase
MRLRLLSDAGAATRRLGVSPLRNARRWPVMQPWRDGRRRGSNMAVYRPTYTDKKTGQTKQQRIWWYEFTFAGRTVRASSKSTRKTIATQTEENRRKELEKAYSGGGASEPPAHHVRTVTTALAAYAKTYPVNHTAKSIAIVKERSPHLEKHLGNLLMPDLTEDRMKVYMADRKMGGASNRTIIMELDVLARATGSKFQILWPKLRKLKENHDVGRALESLEEKAILDAASKNRSRLIFPFLYTLAWTGLRSDEARTLRWSQVKFDTGEIVVGKAKTEAGRGRRIPMTANLKVVLEQHESWYAGKLGKIQPDWFVFPSFNRLAPVDPMKPVKSLKTAWESIREKAHVKCRLRDLRHSFCTKLAEAGVPEITMLDMMGHVSAAMLKRYSHIRARARREAIDSIEFRQNSNVPLQESLQVSDSAKSKTAVTH